MKILVSGINYAPDLIGIAKYTTEMCQYLRDKGHEVRVVTAPPYYPDWRIVRPYRGFAYTDEILDGIKVLRCPLYVPNSPRAAFRILHHLSFALASGPALIVEALKFRPDIVLTIAPSLFGTPAVVAAGKLTGAGTWLHIQDFEVDAAFNMKFVSGGGFRRAALWLESRLLRAIDSISAISAKMVDMLQSKGVPRARIVEFRNWVDTAAISSMIGDDAAQSLRASLLSGGASTIALYAGNMGAKQGLDVVAEVARKLAPIRPDILFVLCGSGAMKEKLQQSTAGLRNVKFLDLQPANVFRHLLVSADIHLLPQCQEIQDLALPSKLGGMLASGVPIVAMAEQGTQLASELAGVGTVIPPGDVDGLSAAVVKLADDPAMRARCATESRELASLRWDRDVVLSQFELKLKDFLSKRQKGRRAQGGIRSPSPVEPSVLLEDELQLSQEK